MTIELAFSCNTPDITYNCFMIIAYLKSKSLKPEAITNQNFSLISDALWLDVYSPSKEEETLLEKTLKIDIPTREEIREIELSNRFYTDNSAIYMTANVLSKEGENKYKNNSVTLIYMSDKLITVHYIGENTFTSFIAQLAKLDPENYHAMHLTMELLNSKVARLADTLEYIGNSLDEFSQNIFQSNIIDKTLPRTDYKRLLQDIGSNGDLSTKIGESLMSFNLLITYLEQTLSSKLDVELKSKLSLLEKDVKALNNHGNFISNKVNFLLEATLGMITLEQNDIIKIFSIAAVMFLPPTLIASIYGMNFKFIPELTWYYGYPLAIVLMMISAWIPYKFFKRKKWL